MHLGENLKCSQCSQSGFLRFIESCRFDNCKSFVRPIAT